MGDDLMSRNLLWANLCSDRISRALRQYRRLQKAYKRMRKEEERAFAAHHGDGPIEMPQAYAEVRANYEDHLYFFVTATRQALKAAWVLEQRGEVMPEFRQAESLRAWRDYEEHWDAEARGVPSKARETWKTHSEDEEPGLSTTGRGYRLHSVSGVSLRRLRRDLRRARDAASAVSEREWHYCYITATEAAGILGVTLTEFEAMPNKPMHHDFGPESDGVRYWRDWVEARRDGRSFPPGWGPYL